MVKNMITLRLEELLEQRGKTLYWLASPNGADVEYNTLWRLKEGRTMSVSFELLEKLCNALECKPGDILDHSPGGPHVPKRRTAKGRKSPGRTPTKRPPAEAEGKE